MINFAHRCKKSKIYSSRRKIAPNCCHAMKTESRLHDNEDASRERFAMQDGILQEPGSAKK